FRNISEDFDSTCVQNWERANLSAEENMKEAGKFVCEAIEENFKLIMIRPEVVKLARKRVDEAQSEVLVGTVIDFPNGDSSVEDKLKEARQAIEDGADELDFVIDYKAFKRG